MNNLKRRQESLNRLYKKHWPKLSFLLSENPNLSKPLLINIPEEYYKQPTKLMIFGQQTRGWGRGSISDLLSCYKKFNFGENLSYTPFWNIIRKIEKICEIESYNIVWNNLNKCAYNENRPPRNLEQKILNNFPVIKKEINIVEPDAILFLSGPKFDQHLRKLFEGCSFQNIQNFSKRKFSKIKHKLLPVNTYRTYHPHYLRRSGMEDNVLKRIQISISQ